MISRKSEFYALIPNRCSFPVVNAMRRNVSKGTKIVNLANNDLANIEVGNITRARALTTSLAGRFIVSAGMKHFVSDTRASSGGPGEAIGAGELLLSALVSCALGLIQDFGRNAGSDFGDISIEASLKRNSSDPTRYDYIKLMVHFEPHVPEVEASAGIANFTEKCPIYNTLRRGGNISIERSAVS